MIVAYDNRNILSENKLGVTDLVFELSALEFGFFAYFRSFRGQIIHHNGKQGLIYFHFYVANFFSCHREIFHELLRSVF